MPNPYKKLADTMSGASQRRGSRSKKEEEKAEDAMLAIDHLAGMSGTKKEGNTKRTLIQKKLGLLADKVAETNLEIKNRLNREANLRRWAKNKK